MDVPQIKVISTQRAVEILKEHGMSTDPQKIGLGLLILLMLLAFSNDVRNFIFPLLGL